MPSEVRAMFCARCGAANPDDGKFCVGCGTQLQNEAGTLSAGLAISGPPQTSGSSPQGYTGPPKTSGMATASLICGILFFIFPAAVAAVILGHLSLSEIKKSAGRLTGRGMAITGLVLGYFGAVGLAFIAIILIIAAIAIPNLLRSRMAANEASAVGSLRTINAAAIAYSSTYSNGFPASLSILDGAGNAPAGCDHAQLLDSTLASGRKSGYVFTYAPAKAQIEIIWHEAKAPGCTVPGAAAYEVHADPLTPGTTGQRSFYTDQTGVIRYEYNGVATAGSAPLQ